MCRRRLGHVPSKRAHGVAELRHGVYSDVEKLANQRCISMHNDFIRRVKDVKRVKVEPGFISSLQALAFGQERHAMPFLTKRKCKPLGYNRQRQ